MPIPEYESLIFDRITSWIKQGHHGLKITHPLSTTVQLAGQIVPSPDLIVENPATGKSLAIEIKAVNRLLPIGVFPQLKEMRDRFTSAGSDFVVMSSAPPTGVLSSNFHQSGISWIEAEDPNKAFEMLEPKLQKLEAL